MKKEICRISDRKMVEGVCGGIAKYFGKCLKSDVRVSRFVML